MTEGNPKLLVRVTPELRAEIKECMEKRNRGTRDEPWDLSAFIRVAIREKIHKMKRSRRNYKRRRSAQATPAKLEG